MLSATRWLLSVALLAAALSRANFISLGYLLFFLWTCFAPPLRASAQRSARLISSASSSRAAQARVWRPTTLFYVVLSLYTFSVCTIHIVYQIILESSSSTGEDSANDYLGFRRITSPAQGVQDVLPDAAMLVVALTVSVLVMRFHRRERPPPPERGVVLLKFAAVLLLFVAGIASPSAFSAVFFTVFLVLLLLWALFPERFALSLASQSSLPRITPLVPLLMAAHLVLAYLYQFAFVYDGFSAEDARVLGFFRADRMSTNDIPRLVGFVAEAALIFVLSQFNRRRDEARQAAASPLDSKTSSAHRLLNRMIRTHGRKLCVVVMFVTAFTLPSWISLGLLALMLLASVVTDAQFVRLVAPILLYSTAALLTQYLFAIPDLLPSGNTYDLIGLSKHDPVPVRYLVVAALPAFFFAGFAHLMKRADDAIDDDSVRDAARHGDFRLIERAVELGVNLSDKRFEPHNSSLLHIAAQNGHVRIVRLLLPLFADANVADADGNTALHLAYSAGEDEVCSVLLLEAGASTHIGNADGKLWNQVPRSMPTRIRRIAQGLYALVETTFLDNADKLTLIVLYLAGTDHIHYLQLGYMVFFVVFLSSPTLSRKLWPLLVTFCFAALALLYSWALFISDENENPDDYDWASKLGLLKADNLWLDLLPFYAAALFSAMQVHVYRRLAEEEHRALQEDALRREQANPYLSSHGLSLGTSLVRFIWMLQRWYVRVAPIIAYVALVVVALYDHVTLIRLGYLVLFMLAMAVYMASSQPKDAIRRLWYLMTFYTAMAFFVDYAFQFRDIEDWVGRHYPQSWEKRVSLEYVGLSRADRRIFLHLLAPALVFIFTVFSMRALIGDSDDDDNLDERIAQLSPTAANTSPLLKSTDPAEPDNDIDVPELRLAELDGSDLLADEAVHPEDVPSTLHYYLLATVQAVQAFLYLHSAKVLALVVWLIVSLVDSPSIAKLFLLLLTLASLPIRGGRLMWLPVGLYSALLVLAQYLFQFPDVVRHENDDTKFYGFRNFHSHLFRHLSGNLAIFVLATIQRVALNKWRSAVPVADRIDEEAGASAIVVPQRSESRSEKRHEREEQYRLQKGRSKSWQEVLWFFEAAYLRLKSLVLSFYSLFGMQITMLALLLAAFARSNMLSVVYVVVVLGVYVRRDRRGLARIWRLVVALLLCSIVVQYYFIIGSLPHSHTSYPWDSLSVRYKRWYCVGGFSAKDLNWDFAALFFAALQVRYFHKQAKTVQRAGDDSDDEASALIVGESADAWYNTAWGDLRMGFFMTADKLTLLFMFLAGTSHADLLNFGYVLLAMILVTHRGLYEGNPGGAGGSVGKGFRRHIARWRMARLFNFAVLAVLIAYQFPWFWEHTEGPHGPVEWEELIGFVHFAPARGHGSPAHKALSSRGALDSIIIFLLIDVQLMIFSSDAYLQVLSHFHNQAVEASRRGAISAFTWRGRRLLSLARILRRRRLFGATLRRINRKLLDLKHLKPFRDEELYPTPCPPGQKPTDLVYDSDQESGDVHPADEVALDPEEEGHLPPELLQYMAASDESDSEWENSGDETPKIVPSDEDEAKSSDAEESGRASPKAVPVSPKSASEAEKEPGFVENMSNSFRSWLTHRIDWVLFVDLHTVERSVAQAERSSKRRSRSRSKANRARESGTRYKRIKDAGISLAHTSTTLKLLWRFLLSNTQMICFVLYIVNAMANPSFVSLLMVAAVFLYASLVEPRAPRGFWTLAVSYSAVSVCLKFLFQLDAFCVTAVARHYSLQPSPYCSSLTTGYTPSHEIAGDFMLGIHKTDDSSTFGYVLWDVLCIIAVVLHGQILAAKGVWNFDERERMEFFGQGWDEIAEETTESSKATAEGMGTGSTLVLRGQSSKRLVGDTRRMRSSQDSASDDSGSDGDDEENLLPPDKQRGDEGDDEVDDSPSLLERISALLYGALPGPLQEHVYMIVPRTRHSIHLVKPGRDYYMTSFVVEMFNALFILFAYSRMASTSSRSISSSVSSNAFSGTMVLTLLAQVVLIILDRYAYLARDLGFKLFLHCFNVVMWLSLLMFVWPTGAQTSLTDNRTLQVFMFFKCIFLLLSATQIKHGFPTVERTGFQYLTRTATVMRAYVYRTYRALPFVFELRTLLDWMVHDSALDLWESFKLEDVYAEMFIVQCDLVWYSQHKRGHKQPRSSKYWNGSLVFVLLVLVIFLPLLVFSTSSPSAKSNNVIGTDVSIYLTSTTGEFRLLTISAMSHIGTVGTTTYQQLKRRGIVNDEAQDRVQSIRMVPFANDVWTISPPAEAELRASLNDTTSRLRFEYVLHRPGPSTNKIVNGFTDVRLSADERERIRGILTGSSPITYVDVPGLLPDYLRLTATESPKVITSSRSAARLSLQEEGSGAQLDRFWVLTQGTGNAGVGFTTVSEPVFDNLFGLSGFAFSVIGLYSVVVLTVARFVRMSFGGQMHTIPYYDLQNVDDLITFCEAIYIARYARLFMKEERLYRQLIKIFRSQPLLQRLTRRKDKQE